MQTKERRYAPRITVELPLELVEWLQALPYGTKRPLFTAIVEDIKKACDKLGPDGKPLKYVILTSLIERHLRFGDISTMTKEMSDGTT
jgi:hypothetical protein